MAQPTLFQIFAEKLFTPKKYFSVLIVVLLVVFTITPAQAQVVNFIPCGDLAAADCDLLTSAVEQTLSAESSTLIFNVQALLSSSSTAAFTLSGRSTYVLNGFGSFIPQLSFDRAVFNPQNYQQMAEVADGFLSDLQRLNSGIYTTITLAPELGLNISAPIVLDAQLVDGIGYLQFDDMQALLNNPTLSGIGGLDLVNLSRALLAQEPELIEEMALPDYFYLNTNILVQNAADADFLDPYVTVERLEDEDRNAVFQMTANLEGLLADAEFRDWVARRALMHRQFFTEERVNQALFFASILAQDTELVMQGRVDLDTNQLTLLNGALQMQTESAVVQPPIGVEFTFQWRDLNSTEPVAPPADARILPYEMLVQQAS